MEEINLSYVTVRYKSPIVYLTFKEGAELGFPEMKELIEHAEKLSEGTSYLILSDVRANVTITPVGRKFSSDAKNAPFHRGTGVLANNPLFKLAVNFFADLKNPSFPLRVFTEEEQAIEWLLSLPLENQFYQTER